MGGYLRTHWTGRQALVWSFWVNFALLCAAINLIEPAIRPYDPNRSGWAIAAAIGYLIIGHVLIYPWQVIGLLRACNRQLTRSNDAALHTAIQGAMILSLIAGLVTMSSTLHSIVTTPPRPAPELALLEVEARIPGYELEVIAEHDLIRVDGAFDIGLTRDLKEMLLEEPAVRGIVLNSDGGRIYEARGVARLIHEQDLETYVYDMCQSACTTAFIAGKRRHLSEQGRLGFHQYRMQARNPFIDSLIEQDKDKTFYEAQGVAPAMLARVFKTPHNSMWYPDPYELLEANVIHHLIRHEAL